MRIPHLSTSRHALDGDELIGEIRRRKRQLLSARLAGTLTWGALDDHDDFLAEVPPKLDAERVAAESRRKLLERDVKLQHAKGGRGSDGARERLINHVRGMTVFNEKARIFTNERFWFKYWEGHVACQDTLFVKLKEEVLPDVVYGEDGRPEVRIAEEEAMLDAAFDKSFDELLAEMKDPTVVDLSSVPPPDDATEQSSTERRAKSPATVVRRVAGAQFEFGRVGRAAR